MEKGFRKAWMGVMLLVLSGVAYGGNHQGPINSTVTVQDGDTIGGTGAVTIQSGGQIKVDNGNWASIANAITNESTQSPGILVDRGQLYFNNPDTSYAHNNTGTITVTNGGVLGVISSTKTSGRSVSSIFDKTTMTGSSSGSRSWVVFNNGTDTKKNIIEGDIKFASIANSGLRIMDKMTFTGEIDLLANGTNTKIEIAPNKMDVDITFDKAVKTHKMEITGIDPDLDRPNAQHNYNTKVTFEDSVVVQGAIEMDTRYDAAGKSDAIHFKKNLTAGSIGVGRGTGTNTFDGTVTLTDVDEALTYASMLFGNSGTNIFNGAVDSTLANSKGGGGIILTQLKKIAESTPSTPNTTIFNNAVNVGTGVIQVGYNKALDDMIKGEGHAEEIDPNGKAVMQLGTNGNETVAVTAKRVSLFNGGTLKVNTDATINGALSFNAGSAVDYANSSRKLTVNGDIDTQSGTNLTFGGKVEAIDLSINGSSKVTFKEDVKLSGELEIMDGNAITLFEKSVTADVLATDSIPGNGDSVNTFKGVVTLTGDGHSEKINNNYYDLDLAVMSGTNTFEKAVILKRTNSDANDAQNTAFFMRSHNTFKDELNVGDGKGIVNIGYWEDLGDWLNSSANPWYDEDNEKMKANPDYYKQTATVLLTNNAKITAGKVNVRGNGVLAVSGKASISGDTVFHEGSQLQLGKDRTDTSLSSLAVGGVVTIEDNASLVVLGIDGRSATGFELLSAAKGIEGKFSDVTSLYNLRMEDNAIYTDGVKDIGVFFEEYGFRPTQEQRGAFDMMGRVMGGDFHDPDLPGKLSDSITKAGDIYKQDRKKGEAAVAQLTGRHGLAGASALQDTTAKFGSSMQGRQGNIRAANSSRGGMASAGGVEGVGSAYGDLRAINQGYSSFDPNRIWAGGFGAWTRQDDKNGQFGYKYNSGGVILGYDRELGDFVFGVSTAYSNGTIKNNEGFTKTDVDTFNVGLYGSYNHCSGLFVDVTAGFGYAWNKTKTSDIINGGTKDGKYRNNSFQAGMKVGYDFALPSDFHIIPSVGVDYTHVHQRGWSENTQSSNQIANWYDRTNNDYLSIPVGVRINKTFRIGDCAEITPEVRGAWIYEAKDPQSRVRMGYVGSTASATLYGIDPGRSRGLVGAGLKARVKNVDAFVDYNYEFRSGYKNHNLMAGLGLSF